MAEVSFQTLTESQYNFEYRPFYEPESGKSKANPTISPDFCLEAYSGIRHREGGLQAEQGDLSELRRQR